MLPAALVVGALYMTVAGEEGLLARHALKQRVTATEKRVERVAEDNARKRAHIQALRQDPAALKRAAAETLLVAEPGSTLYRLD